MEKRRKRKRQTANSTGKYRELTTGSIYGFLFTNVYDKPGESDPPGKEDPKDPEVPKGDMEISGEEIEEAEIPLGDAPEKGDASKGAYRI